MNPEGHLLSWLGFDCKILNMRIAITAILLLVLNLKTSACSCLVWFTVEEDIAISDAVLAGTILNAERFMNTDTTVFIPESAMEEDNFLSGMAPFLNFWHLSLICCRLLDLVSCNQIAGKS